MNRFYRAVVRVVHGGFVAYAIVGLGAVALIITLVVLGVSV